MTKRVTAIVILCAWLVLMLGAVVLSEATKTFSDSPYQDKMLEAVQLAQKAFDAIKDYKQNHGIELNEEDLLNTGMLGKKNSYIHTTSGKLESKRTSINPHWAAVVYSMFVKANLRKGDQVLMVFSGSFPALNICAIAAGQIYGLDMCLMGSVGASNYGATDEDFNFFDMMTYLCGLQDEKPSEKIFDEDSMLDYVSLGGGDDCGDTYAVYCYGYIDGFEIVAEQYREKISNRIQTFKNVIFAQEKIFYKNIERRMDYVKETAPNVKFVLNVGGSMVGLGTGFRAHLESGYVSPGIVVNNGAWVKQDRQDGLLQRYLQKGIPVASLLNMQGMSETYGIAYNPTERSDMPDVDDTSASNVYFTTKYNLVIPVVALAVTVAVAVLFCVLRIKNKIEVRQNERNHILCRR